MTGDRQVAVANGRDIGALCTLLNLDREVLDLSTDRAFDGIPGLTLVEPADLAQRILSDR